MKGLFHFHRAFAKLRNANISYVMSVYPSVSQWTDFHEIWYLGIFRTSVGKINFH